jgi:discoidin domain receptor family protein 2
MYVFPPFQVFREARVFLSVGGKLYPGDPISYIPMEDCIFEDPKNVTIKLHHRVAQFVKIQLFWATKWILISEVTFESREYSKLYSSCSMLNMKLETSHFSPSRIMHRNFAL